MSVYNWETSGNGQHRKKAKKTGTVVLHTDERADTSFARLQKEVPVERLHMSQKDAEDALANPHANAVKTALMTVATAEVLEHKMGFEELLPCQAQCYRGIFNGRDVILHSRTGSGKTLAYALPLVERYLLLEQQQQASTDAAPGPFLLIFVFSNDLAMQTKSVLEKIYSKQTNLRIAVAGFDDLQPHPVAAANGENGSAKKRKKAKVNNGGSVDILIGTVRAIDEAIRGRKAAAAATAEEDAEAQRVVRLVGTKQPRRGDSADKASAEEEDADADAANVSEDDEDEPTSANTAAAREAGVISPARVRAIVVDEVDLTLGPRFSALGRRMKNLLKFIRRANGALVDGLLTDFRAHHYVLCGATIPNWVLKAGFLGVKKYYYQLVAVGSAKLPPQLECYELACPGANRTAVATQLLTKNGAFTGRVVVFGTLKQLAALEAALVASAAAAAEEASPKKNSSKKKSASPTSAAVALTSSSGVVVRALTAEKDEMERVAAIEDFNCGVAPVLLCTDVAARGLDFTAVDTVLMLNLPRNTLGVDTFVHRAGRTARVGRPGKCVLLHETNDAVIMDAIARSTHVVFKALPAVVTATLNVRASSAAAGGKDTTPAAAVAAATASVVSLKLIVRNPFRYTKPNIKVPSALQVLESNVTGDLKVMLTDIREEEGSNGEVVLFRAPVSHAHEVKQKLWKYTLEEATH